MKVGKIAVLLAVLVLFGTCAYAADCNLGGRYEDNNNGTVTDCRTGLIWLKNAKCTATSNGIANPNGYLTWYNAQKWVVGLYGDGSSAEVCGLSDGSVAGDWRLPTKTEWMAMVEYAKRVPTPAHSDPALTNGEGTAKWTSGDVFTNVLSNDYWSSTTSASLTDHAWLVYMLNGLMYNINKANDYYVWPVRGGQSGSFGSLRIE
jgi:hypothetical protein